MTFASRSTHAGSHPHGGVSTDSSPAASFGYFHAYGHAAARDDIDLVVLTGDYIYEYGRSTYPSEADTVPGRIIDPSTKMVRLGDYYHSYAIYHADPDLQALRQSETDGGGAGRSRANQRHVA